MQKVVVSDSFRSHCSRRLGISCRQLALWPWSGTVSGGAVARQQKKQLSYFSVTNQTCRSEPLTGSAAGMKTLSKTVKRRCLIPNKSGAVPYTEEFFRQHLKADSGVAWNIFLIFRSVFSEIIVSILLFSWSYFSCFSYPILVVISYIGSLNHFLGILFFACRFLSPLLEIWHLEMFSIRGSICLYMSEAYRGKVPG